MTAGIRTIAHVTDAHLGQKVQLAGGPLGSKMNYLDEPDEHKANLIAVFDDLARRNITEVVFGGDIGTPAANKWFFELVSQYRFKLHMVLGNHDALSETAKYHDSGFKHPEGKMDYALRAGAFKHVFLDSSVNAVDDRQLDWLAGEIAQEARVLLFMHHPVLAIDTILDRLVAFESRDSVKRVLVESGSDVDVFCGHYHMTDTASDGKIRQHSTPATSYQIGKDSDKLSIDTGKYGYRRIVIDGPEIRTDVVMFGMAQA